MLQAYRYTKGFPKDELYVLTTQFKRATISVAANISEGHKKKSKADKARIFNIAQGSLEECQYYLILAQDLEYGDNTNLRHLLDEVAMMLESYIQKILSSNS